MRQSRLRRMIFAQRLPRNWRLAALPTTASQTPNPGHALRTVDLCWREPFPNMVWLTPPQPGKLFRDRRTITTVTTLLRQGRVRPLIFT